MSQRSADNYTSQITTKSLGDTFEKSRVCVDASVNYGMTSVGLGILIRVR
ncbi:MAG: hypothetical protein WCR52_06350 [Bacteroidota bacterium]